MRSCARRGCGCSTRGRSGRFRRVCQTDTYAAEAPPPPALTRRRGGASSLPEPTSPAARAASKPGVILREAPRGLFFSHRSTGADRRIFPGNGAARRAVPAREAVPSDAAARPTERSFGRATVPWRSGSARRARSLRMTGGGRVRRAPRFTVEARASPPCSPASRWRPVRVRRVPPLHGGGLCECAVLPPLHGGGLCDCAPSLHGGGLCDCAVLPAQEGTRVWRT